MVPPEPIVFQGKQGVFFLVWIKGGVEPHEIVEVKGVDGFIEVDFAELRRRLANGDTWTESFIEELLPKQAD